MAKKRGTTREVGERREWIQELMLKGMKTAEIKARVCTEEGVAERTVENDITAIYRSWESERDEKRGMHRNKALDRLEMLFKSAMQSGNLKSALEIQKEINKIYGLHNQTESKSEVPKFIEVKKKSELKVVGE